jgi:hypothetical protein
LGPGRGEFLAAWAKVEKPSQLFVYLTYRGVLGSYAARSDLRDSRPVTAVDFYGDFRSPQINRQALFLGPARSLALGRHPGFLRVAIAYLKSEAPDEAFAEVLCFRPDPLLGQGLAAIRLTLGREGGFSGPLAQAATHD